MTVTVSLILYPIVHADAIKWSGLRTKMKAITSAPFSRRIMLYVVISLFYETISCDLQRLPIVYFFILQLTLAF